MSMLHAFIGAAWSYVAIAGVTTVLAKWGLRRRLDRIETPEAFDTPGVFVGLVSASLIPFLWLASAAVHSSSYGAFVDGCCRWMSLQSLGWQQVVLATGAVALLVAQLVSTYRQWRRRHGVHSDASNREACRRVEALVDDTPELRTHRSLVRVVTCPEQICAVRGILQPRIEISAELIHTMERASLRAALLHEVAHLKQADPLRTAVSLFADVLNPFSLWLERERRAWQFARELRCDQRALADGAEPVHLADALVTTARAKPETTAATRCGLCGDEADALETRVELLLFGDLEAAATDDPRYDLFGLAASSSIALLVPHLLGGGLLQFHCCIEWLLT